ncbi:MAG: Rieske (2Fe-2S) iron-sulfur domain protein [Geobacteraceae bacterium]|nr:Rieske (2Fe-2S) iron-sulfur domain protein [Geobacteraceae bacterium]
MHGHDRRKFLGLCLGGITFTLMGAAIYPVFKFLAPLQTRKSAGKVEIRQQDLAEGEAKFIEFGGEPAVVVNSGEHGLIALSAVCTHLGCIVQWERDKRRFLCPCHAGLYTESGEVISGPPPKQLPKLPLSVNNGIITVG